jgi:hypothetical protein
MAVFREVGFDAIVAEQVRAGFLYWQSLCGTRPFPAREDLKPHAIKPLLRHLVLIKVLDGARDFHMVVVGDEVQRAYDVVLNARLLSDILAEAPAVMPGWMERYRQVALSGKPAFFQVINGTCEGEANFIQREAVVLPFGENGAVSHVVTFGKHELKPGR